MYLCKCGREFKDPIAMTECELAGHPLPGGAEVTAEGADMSVELVLRSLTDEALIRAVDALTTRDRIPFRALLRELAWRLATLNLAGVQSSHGNRDAKPRHHETAQGSDSE